MYLSIWLFLFTYKEMTIKILLSIVVFAEITTGLTRDDQFRRGETLRINIYIYIYITIYVYR